MILTELGMFMNKFNLFMFIFILLCTFDALPLLCVVDFVSSNTQPELDINKTIMTYAQKEEKVKAISAMYDNEKPDCISFGRYRGGRYINFSLDAQGLFIAAFAGSVARLLYSAANCGSKLETFKKAILYPGVAKSGLFWVPSYCAYQYVTKRKMDAAALLESQRRLEELEIKHKK